MLIWVILILIMKIWFKQNNIVTLSLELPFANNDGQKVTPQNARLFGKDIADAISIYLQGM